SARRTPAARGASAPARTANAQAELDLIHATELAKVALDGLLAARSGADWRARDHARDARAPDARRRRAPRAPPSAAALVPRGWAVRLDPGVAEHALDRRGAGAPGGGRLVDQ